MKAYVLNRIGQLDFCEVPKPVLQKGEALVEVRAAGICGSDIPRIFQNGTYHFPTIPGHEFSGLVREVFGAEDEALVGKRVGVFPLIPCRTCSLCQTRQYEMCMQYDYLGSRRDGGFAEYVAVPIWNLLELPDEVSFEAAAMMEPAAVGVHALGRIAGPVKSVSIFGPGTIGLLMAQWFRAFGAEHIYLVGTNDGQKAMAETLGFSLFYNGRERDGAAQILEQTGGQGTDAAVECVGCKETLSDCLQAVKRGGDVIIVGNPREDIRLSKDSYWQILRKQLHLSGTWNSSYVPEEAEDDWRRTRRAIMDGTISPEKQITHKLAFDDLLHGLLLMRDKTEYYNKVMIVR
jgi:L-iditol 2-dehydrogenase